MYDDKTDEFQIDYDTQDAKFDGAPLFDTASNEWITLEENHWADDSTPYNKAADLLHTTLQHLTLEEEE
jgi:hypothetical protein